MNRVTKWSWLLSLGVAFLHSGVHAKMSTPGQFGVSDSGAATFSIALQVPPGTAGVEPKLALGYNSQAGNGLLGIGWSLNGISSITRCPKSRAQDGAMGAINFDANDRFCLDGQRLLVVAGTYGADGAEYRTERESFSKIVSYGTAGNGPAWFKVWTKAGQIIEYGNTADSRIEVQGRTTARLWSLNRLQDTKGNYLTASYVEDTVNGDFYPQRIDYTGNAAAGIAPNASVQFQYEARPATDLTPLYQAGALSKNAVRLTKVQTYVGTTLVKQYELVYHPTMTIRGSRLTGVQECSGGVCLQPIFFGWENSDSAGFQQAFQQNVNASGDRVYFGDFDGDGKTDLFLTPAPGTWSGWKMLLSNGSSFNQTATGIWPSTNERFYFGDFNGDGKTDFLVTPSSATSSGSWSGWKLYLSTGTGFVESANGSWPSYGDDIRIGDFDGDGKTDLFVTPVGTAWTGWKVLSSTGAGFTETASGSWPSYNERFFLGDFDGDGRTDFLVTPKAGGGAFNGWKIFSSTGSGFVETANGSWPSYGDDIYFGDFNGDGKLDLMAVAKSNEIGWTGWRTFLSTGTAFVAHASGASPSYTDNLYFGDFNGDGKTDLIAVPKNASAGWSGWREFLANGNGFVQAASGAVPSYNDSVAIGEFNGDGKTDLLTTSLTPGTNGLTVYQANDAYKGDRIITITGSLQQITTISYLPLTNSTIYAKDAGANAAAYPGIDLQIPLYVVNSVAAPNGSGGVISTTYRYGGLKSDLTGRGLLGFRWIDSVQSETGVTSHAEYRQDWPYTGMQASVTKTLAGAGNGGVLKRVTNLQSCAPLTGSGCNAVVGNRYFPFVSQSVESSWDLNGAAFPSVTTNYQYDAWGNPTQISVNTSDGFTKTTVNTFSNDSVNWLLGRLTNATVTNTKP